MQGLMLRAFRARALSVALASLILFGVSRLVSTSSLGIRPRLIFCGKLSSFGVKSEPAERSVKLRGFDRPTEGTPAFVQGSKIFPLRSLGHLSPSMVEAPRFVSNN